MTKKSKSAPRPRSAAPGIPNLSLSRTVRTGEKTEDELLLERPRGARPVARVPEQAEFTHGDPWRVLRIQGEFVHAFDALAEVGAAITVFGSARTPPDHPMYVAAQHLGFLLAKSGFAVITGGGARNHGSGQPRRPRGRRVIYRLQH